MPRSLVIGNGQILAAFDEKLQMRDFYFPFVGLEDHTTYGRVHRLGFEVEGRGFSWVSDEGWHIEPRYAPETLAGDSILRNEHLGIEATICDEVHPVHNVLLRHMKIRNLQKGTVTVKVFAHHDFYLYSDKQKDTAFYEPYTNTVIHYRQKRYMLIGGHTSDPKECITGTRGGRYASVLKSRDQLQQCGISSFTVGKSNYRGLEGTWKDAEDGELSRNAIEQGSVDSTVAIHALVSHDKETEV